MVNEVKVEATYESSKQVPTIGQRKKMRVNGAVQTLTLNDLKVSRRGVWNEDKSRFGYEFDAIETWGEFFIS